jgi:hypothetical protein
MTIRGKIVVSLVTGHDHSEEEIEYVKSLRHTNGQTDAGHLLIR